MSRKLTTARSLGTPMGKIDLGTPHPRWRVEMRPEIAILTHVDVRLTGIIQALHQNRVDHAITMLLKLQPEVQTALANLRRPM